MPVFKGLKVQLDTLFRTFFVGVGKIVPKVGQKSQLKDQNKHPWFFYPVQMSAVAEKSKGFFTSTKHTGTVQ